MSDLENQKETKWNLCGLENPKECIQYFSQLVILFSVIIASIINISMGKGNTEMWISLLSTCIGIMIPSPSLKK